MTLEEVQFLALALYHIPDQLNKSDVKSMFRILIAHGIYPTCAGCGDAIVNIDDFSWDHDKPKSRGGSNGLENMQPMHRVCNNYKGNSERKLTAFEYKKYRKMRTDEKEVQKSDIGLIKYREHKRAARGHVRIMGWHDPTNFFDRFCK